MLAPENQDVTQIPDLTLTKVPDLSQEEGEEVLTPSQKEIATKLTEQAFGKGVKIPRTKEDLKDANRLADELYLEEERMVNAAAVKMGAERGVITPEQGLSLFIDRDDEAKRRYNNMYYGDDVEPIDLSGRESFFAGLVSRSFQLASAEAAAEIVGSASENKEEQLNHLEKATLHSSKMQVLNAVAKEKDIEAQEEQSKQGWTSKGLDLLVEYAPFGTTYVANAGRLEGVESSLSEREVSEGNFDFIMGMVADDSISAEAFEKFLRGHLDKLSPREQRAFIAGLFGGEKNLLEQGFDVASLATGGGRFLGNVGKSAHGAYKLAKAQGVSRSTEALKKGAQAGIKKAAQELPKEAIDQVVPFGYEGIEGASKLLKKPLIIKEQKLLESVELKRRVGANESASAELSSDLSALHKGERTVNDVPTLLNNVPDSVSLPTMNLSDEPISRSKHLLTEEGVLAALDSYVVAYRSLAAQLPSLSHEALVETATRVATGLASKSPNLFADLLDMNWDFRANAKGEMTIKVLKGTGLHSSSGFTTKKAAEALRDAYKVEGGGVVDAVVTRRGRKYFVEADIKLGGSAGSLTTDYIQRSSKGVGRKTQSSLPAFLQSVFTVSNKSHADRILTNLKVQSEEATSRLLDNLVKKFKGLSGSEVDELDRLADISRTKRLWFTPEELAEAGYSTKTIEAYGARRIMNDLDYVLENGRLREKLKLNGYKKYNGVVGKVTKLSGVDKEKVLNVKVLGVPGVIPDAESSLKKADIETKMTKEDYVAVKPLNEEGADVYLIKTNQLVTEELPLSVMSYVPGGRAWYSDDLTFIKQGFGSDGEFKGFRTYYAEGDASLAAKFAEDLEDLRTRFIAGELTDEYVQLKNPKLLPFSSVRELEEYFVENDINLHPAFRIEAVKNGQPLASYVSSVAEGKFKVIEEDDLRDMLGVSNYQFNRRSMMSAERHRTDRQLYNLIGDRLPRISLKEEISQLQRAIISSGGGDAYTELYAENFYKTFKDVIMNSENMTPLEALLYGRMKTDKMDKVSAALNAQRNFFAITRQPTELDKQIDMFTARMFKWFTKEDYLTSKEVSNTYEAFKKLSPLKRLRQTTYHYTMGLFSTHQFVKQASQMIISAALASPLALPRAIRYLGPALAHLASNADPLARKNLVRSLETIEPSFKASDSEAIIEALEHLPWFQGVQGGANIDRVGTFWGKCSAFPALMGEATSRVFNSLLALSEAGISSKKRWGSLSEVEKAEILGRANNLYLNMGSQGLSRVQASEVGATILQLMSFNLRFLETLFSDTEISKGAKGRLALTLMLTTGVQGTLSPIGLGALSYGAYQYFNADDDKDVEILKYVQEGVANVALQSITGRDFNFFPGSTVQLFNILESVEGIKDMNVPIISTGARLLDGLAEAVRVMGYKETLSPEAYRRQLEKLLRSGGLGSSSARLSRAYHIWNTGTLLNSKNLIVAKDLDKVDAVLYALGFDRLEDIYAHRLKDLRMDETQRHAELVNDVGPSMLAEFRAGNYDEAYDIFALYTSDLSDYEKGLIHRKVLNYLRKHLGDTELQRIEKETWSAKLSEQARNAIELEINSHK